MGRTQGRGLPPAFVFVSLGGPGSYLITHSHKETFAMKKKLLATLLFVAVAWLVVGIIPSMVPDLMVYGIAVAAGLSV